MSIRLEEIFRFPVKGVRGETLREVTLAEDEGVPYDRRFAIARGDTKYDSGSPRWLPKQWFVMLMRDADPARLECTIDPAGRQITLRAPDAPPCAASVDSDAGRRQIEAYLNEFLGPRREGPVRFVEAGPTSLTDVPQNCLSMVNLDSVDALAAAMGQPIDPLRFRANLYVRGAGPWAEFDWVGTNIRIGELEFHIPSRIPRCTATEVNPQTGQRDMNIVKGLRAAYGHYDMGVYAQVVRGGRLSVGAPVVPPGAPKKRSPIAHWMRFFGFLARSAPIVLRPRR